ncbi:MAG TPA: radical SAM protein [Anaerolineae bacterium]|nr:radical SAM protein [Anaerolineae bacterium]
MRYIFGPVPSRRLGLSLGLDVIPLKTCTLNCIYCEVGRTTRQTLTRDEYVSSEDVLNELKEFLQRDIKIDWITFSGSGEPTLNSSIGEMIENIKSMTNIPVCVITNGTLLWDQQVRLDILKADAVIPSLDSACEHTFQILCRPHPDLHINNIIEGLVRFRKEYQGKIWLEILFVKGVNDSREELEALRDAIQRIKPDAIHLNTVVRPPAEFTANPLSREELEKILDFFGEKAEIIASFKSISTKSPHIGIDDIREYLKRRPGSVDDISSAFGVEKHEVEKILEHLNKSGEITLREFFGKRFWEYVRAS